MVPPSSPMKEKMTSAISPFEQIRRTNPSGNEFWSSRDFSKILEYNDYRNFEGVIEKARMACFNSGQRVEDHFVEITEMIEIGSNAQRPIKTVMMSRYACYLVIQNADPAKEIVAIGQTYFAVQTRKQEIIAQRLLDVDRVTARERLSKSEKKLSGIIYPE